MEEEKYLSAEAEGRNAEKIKNVFKKVRESESAKRIICRLALFAAAGIVFEFFVAYAFSPLYKGLWDFDVPVFWEIGKGWAKGLLPFRDLMDLKGPLVFLAYRIGYMLFGDRMKMMAVFDILSFALSGAILCETADIILESRSRKNTLLCLCIMALAAAGPWGPGGMVSVYTLPAVSFSWMFLAKWMKSESADHRPLWAFVYGITFGLCMMSRMLDGVAVAAPCLWISICLARKRKWKNLAENVAACAIGAVLACAPFVIYFAACGALGEMMYGTFGMGARYYVYASPFYRLSTLWPTFFYSTMIMVSLVWSAVAAKRNGLQKAGLIISSSVISLMILFATKSSEFYYIPYIPVTVVSAFELIRTARVSSDAVRKRMTSAFIGGLAVIVLSGTYTMSVGRNNMASQSYEFDRDIANVASQIPAKERKKVLLYDIYMKYYRTLNIPVRFKYFCNQKWEIGVVGKSYAKRLSDEIVHKGPKWIIMRMYPENGRLVVKWPSKKASALYEIKTASGCVALAERTDGKKKNKITKIIV